MISSVKSCSIKEPMFCSKEELAELYRRGVSSFPSSELVNSPRMEIIDGANWSFDPTTLTIWNNRYWKGFYPADYDFTNLLMVYGFGFFKRFWKVDGRVCGETHPFYSDIHAANEAKDAEFAGTGKVVVIRYRDFPFSTFHDLMKIVDRDIIIGEAFVSSRDPPYGLSVFHFVLARRYSVDNMTRADCKHIFSSLSRRPTVSEVLGEWDLRLVSDPALSPPILRLRYFIESGELRVSSLVGSALPVGSAAAEFTEDMLIGFDFAGILLHNEIRIAADGLMVGMLHKDGEAGGEKDGIFKAIDGARGFVLKDEEEICLPYVLRRVG